MAAMIAALAVTIAALPSIQGGDGPGGLDGPAIVPRPIVVAFLLGLPAAVAAMAALRASRHMFVAAGMLCLLQSVVAFSGVTLGFVIPGIVLVALGLQRAATTKPSRSSGRGLVAGMLVVGYGIAAWLVPLSTSETVCWIARAGPDGKPMYTRIAETNTFSLGPDDLGAGCDGGASTPTGLMVGVVFAVGALATAGLAGGKRRDPDVAKRVER